MKRQVSDECRAELKRIARVDEAVAHPDLERARVRLGRAALTRTVRQVIADVREQVLNGQKAPDLQALSGLISKRVDSVLGARARRVINGTGVVLHTNWAVRRFRPQCRGNWPSSVGYVSVKSTCKPVDGPRAAFAGAPAELSGAEDALVVNNNAAAVLLALTAVAGPRCHCVA